MCSDLGDVLGCLAQALEDVDCAGQVAGPKVVECLGISSSELFLRNIFDHPHLKLSVYGPGLDH